MPIMGIGICFRLVSLGPALAPAQPETMVNLGDAPSDTEGILKIDTEQRGCQS